MAQSYGLVGASGNLANLEIVLSTYVGLGV